MPRPRKLPSVFDYEDYRPFLRDAYRAWKALDPAFSHGAFAKRAGIPYRSHLKLVMDGRKALTPAFVDRYAKGFRLPEDEARGLRLLMERVHAPDGRSREAVDSALRELRYERQHPVAPEAAQAIIRSWPLRLVFALTRVEGFRADPAWIRRRLGGRVGLAEARSALAFLRRQGLVVVRGKRLLSSAAGRIPFKARQTGRDALRISRRIQGELLGPERGKSWGGVALPAMTAGEAAEVHRRFRQVILSIAGRGVTRPGTELYLVQTAIKPLSAREIVTGPGNAGPEGKPARRPFSKP